MSNLAADVRYAPKAYESIQLSQDRVLVYVPTTSIRHVVSSNAKRLLDGCRRVDSVSGYVNGLLSDFALGDQHRQTVSFAVNDWIQKGLFETFASPRVPSTSVKRFRKQITTLGIVTGDRPKSLYAAVTSYADNVRRHRRSLQVVIMDDAKGRSAQDQNVGILSQLDDRKVLRYCGYEQRCHFADKLSGEGIRPEVSRFGVIGDFAGVQCTTGANRNALLLDTTDELILSVDDDTVCKVVDHPQRRNGLRLISHDGPRDLWPFKTREEVDSFALWKDTDFLGEHEVLLGRRLQDLIDDCSGSLDSVAPCNHLLRGMTYPESRVLVTMSGVVGDSGAYLGKMILMTPRSKAWTVSEDATIFNTALESREVLWVAQQHTITHASPFQAMAIGLANDELLPPFMPIGRNQDGVFGELLGLAAPKGFLGHLPTAIYHAAELNRTYADFPETRISDLIVALQAFLVEKQPETLAIGLRRFGDELTRLAKASDNEFWEILSTAVSMAEGRRSRAIQTTLNAIGISAHDVWKASAAEFHKHIEERITSATFSIPAELLRLYPVGTAKQLTKLLIEQTGAFLSAWHDIVEATTFLRKKGVHVSIGLADSNTIAVDNCLSAQC